MRPVSPAAPREITANSPKTAIQKQERSNHSERPLAVAWRSRRSAVPSQRCLLVVSRCSRAPSRPSSESLTFSMARLHSLVEGVMLCCIPACCLRWNVPGSHWQKNKDIFKRLKQMQRIRSQSRLNDRPTSDSLEKRDDHSNADDSGPLQPLSDAPAELPTLHHGGSRATWNNTLLETPLQPGLEPETTGTDGRRQSVLFSLGTSCPGLFPWHPSLPQGAGIQPFCLRGCQSGN